LLAIVTGAVAVWTLAVLLHLQRPDALRRFGRSLRARSRIVPLALAAASALASCAVAEGIVRGADLMGTSLYGEIESYWWDTVEDPVLMYRHQPNFERTYQGVSVSFNEMGLRDRPLSAREPGLQRIVVLGDSVVFGWGVEVEDTFSRQLERAVRETTRTRVETINTGVCSYNSEMEREFLRRHGDELDPDLVLLVYVDNDTGPTLMPPRDQGSLQGFRRDPVESLKYLLRRSRIYSTIDHIVPAVLSPPTPDPEESGWRASMAAVQDIAAWCAARGITFRVLLFRMSPSPKSERVLADLERVARSAAATGTAFGLTDTLPWFADRNLRRLTNSFLDSHPNPAGHALLAAGAAEWLADDLAP